MSASFSPTRRLLVPRGLEPTHLSVGPSGIIVHASTTATYTRCPMCKSRLERVHRRYCRTVSDLPWCGISVTLKVRVRRFFCANRGCKRSIFCERLPEIAAYARKTSRLEEVLLLVAFEMGGEAGARLARELGLRVSPDSLLDSLRKVPCPPTDEVRVLGIDDFAFRRGESYGTILVDLEQRKVVDLLPDRSAGVLEGWLRRHPCVRIIARDRYGPYIDAASRGAPSAVQVADRWHLLKNLSEAVEKVLERNVLHLPSVRIPLAGPEELEEEPHEPKLPRPVTNYVGWCWRKGYRDAQQIWGEVSGSVPLVCREHFDEFVERLRAEVTIPLPRRQRKRGGRTSLRPSPAEATRLLVRDAEKLSRSECEYLKRTSRRRARRRPRLTTLPKGSFAWCENARPRCSTGG
jgi:hypothetical protein